jgi:hypothetical protein
VGVAFAATVVALLPEQWAGYRLVPPQAEQGDEGPRPPERPDLFSGVVLLTNAKYEPPVELPPLPRRFAPPTRPADPSSIRFSGEYWYFFWPRRGPGSDAVRKLGSPLQLSYNAVDMSALIMQARQPLPKPMKLDCCSAIDVVLQSNELDPASVEVELILIDSTREGSPRWSLGWRALTGAPATAETLRFETRPEPGFPAFNELLVWFHLGMERKARSARLAVERFDLTP